MMGRLALLLTVCTFAVSNAARIHTALDLPDTLTVGDRFQLVIGISAPPGAQITPPVPEEHFGRLTVVDWAGQLHEGDTADSASFSYLLTTYVPETCTIPALSFIVTADETSDTLSTGPMPLPLQSVIPAEARDSVDIRDLKPLLDAGRPSLWWLWTLVVLGAAVLLGWLVYWWIERHRTPPPPPPPPPPYDEAMDALRRLEQENMVKQGKVREYVFALSEILKRYCERRFDVNAQEYTTEEILAWIREASLDRPLRAGVEWFFTTGDPVKFARWLPDDATLKRMEREVRTFVHETRPQASSATGAASESSAESETTTVEGETSGA